MTPMGVSPVLRAVSRAPSTAERPRLVTATRHQQLLALAFFTQEVQSNPRETFELKTEHFPDLGIREEFEYVLETGASRESPVAQEAAAEFGRASPLERVNALNVTRGRGAIRLKADNPEIGDTEDWVAQQVDQAITNVDIVGASFPQWPWSDLRKLLGPIAYRRLIMIAAATSQGKTAFVMSLVSALAHAGTGVYVCGLESNASELRTKLACLDIGLDPLFPLESRWTELPEAGRWKIALRDALRAQAAEPMRSLVSFDPRRAIGYEELQDAATRAVEAGKRIVIVDHVDRLKQGPGVNPFTEMDRMVKYATDLADQHCLVMIMTTQLNGEAYKGSRIAVYNPPQIHHLHMGGTKRFEAHSILGLYRPRRIEATKEEIKAVESGQADPYTILMPNTMGVKILKHRSGNVEGRQCYLGVERGRIVDIPERDRYVTSPLLRGPRP
jgi:hypothetical protein